MEKLQGLIRLDLDPSSLALSQNQLLIKKYLNP